MAERRMFAKSVTQSARFLTLPAAARLLYYDLGMAADDDGVAEALMVLRMTGAGENDLCKLEERGFVTVLNDELVTHITDWPKNNLIRQDRYRESIYKPLLVAAALKKEGIFSDNQRLTQDRIGKDRVGQDSTDQDSAGEDRGSGCVQAQAREEQTRTPTPSASLTPSAPPKQENFLNDPSKPDSVAAPPLSEEVKRELLANGVDEEYAEERLTRAIDYAKSRGEHPATVLLKWWREDRAKGRRFGGGSQSAGSHGAGSRSAGSRSAGFHGGSFGSAGGLGNSFDSDDFFAAAIARTADQSLPEPTF